MELDRLLGHGLDVCDLDLISLPLSCAVILLGLVLLKLILPVVRLGTEWALVGPKVEMKR